MADAENKFTDLGVVVPAYNEAMSISNVLHQLKQHIVAQNIIVVDDGSSDETLHLSKLEGVTVVRHFLNTGQGGALRTGFDMAISRSIPFIASFDSDGQHQVSDLLDMYRHLKANKELDLVLGSRFFNRQRISKNIPFLKMLVLKLAVIFSRIMHGLELTDTHNGLRIFRINAYRRLELRTYGMAHASEILHEISKKKLRYEERPTNINYSDYSKAKGQSLFNIGNILMEFVIGRKI
jgi:glycosyltransferase involved in cell wall biosynthesis